MSYQQSQETTFAVTTLGCKVNQADSEAIGEQMSAAGFVQRDFNEPADIYIVNTCTVTHLGDRSSRQLIAQAQRRRPEALLVVTGCYAELNPQAVSTLPGVNLVIGNSQKDALVEAIKQHQQDANASSTNIAPEPITRPTRMLPVVPFGTQHIGSDHSLVFQTADEEPGPDNPAQLSPFTPVLPDSQQEQEKHFSRTRVQMKVQDGCDNRCTYCIVPTVRGKSRSRSIASVVEQVQRKTRAGFQEIVLTGIHLGDYHSEQDERLDLGDLISALLKETEMPRIRVSSLEPEDFRLEWLELWRNPRLCRHFHLPMQSGSDAILRRMARRYTSERYAKIITTAKKTIPGLAISTDIITGFPGESDEDFEQTYQLAKELEFAKTHVFRFSVRQGTAAARMRGQIRDEVKKARSQRLLELNESHSQIFREHFLGERVQVLLEACKHGYWEGLTDNYLRVEVHHLPEQTQNWHSQLVHARLSQIVGDGVEGVYIS